jgi:hypothetical protein
MPHCGLPRASARCLLTINGLLGKWTESPGSGGKFGRTPLHDRLPEVGRRPLYCALDLTSFERQHELYDYNRLLFIDRPTSEITENVRVCRVF